jgi:tagatose 6-phosphate kinase
MILTVTLNVAVDKAYTVDELRPGEVIRIRECSYTAGGKGLNVSKTAKIAGADVISTGFVGGYAGTLIEEQVATKHLTCDFIYVGGETRTCINIIDQKSKLQTELLEPGFKINKKEIERLHDRFDKLLATADVVTISGSVPCGCSESIYAEMIEKVLKKGKKVILDSSGNLLATGIKAHPTMVKPNAEEFKALIGKDSMDRDTMLHYAKKLHKNGIEYVVISLGLEGALMICDEGTYWGITPNIPVANTVGCGDSMVAAFAIGFERHYSVTELLRYAVAVSTSSALTMETGSFRLEELPKVYDQCRVIRLDT